MGPFPFCRVLWQSNEVVAPESYTGGDRRQAIPRAFGGENRPRRGGRIGCVNLGEGEKSTAAAARAGQVNRSAPGSSRHQPEAPARKNKTGPVCHCLPARHGTPNSPISADGVRASSVAPVPDRATLPALIDPRRRFGLVWLARRERPLISPTCPAGPAVGAPRRSGPTPRASGASPRRRPSRESDRAASPRTART